MEEGQEVAADVENTLILHRGFYFDHAPSPSPFVLKLETWLRMNKIKYVPECSMQSAKHPKTGKMPWVEWRGENLPDSTLIIERLKRDLDIRMDEDLDERDLAVGRAFQKMLEEQTVWTSGLWRSLYSDGGSKMVEYLYGRAVSLFFYPIFRRSYLNSAHGHGIGRLDKETVLKIAHQDLKSVSDYLGGRQYFLSDERPTTIDASIFGVLGNMLYGMPESCFRSWMEDDFKNLKNYCDRIKDEFWPDWQDLCEKKQ